MQDPATHYRTNHVSFALPARLKDKTVHMFTLSDSGPSDFNVVISHADAGPEETLAEFSDRLLAQLQTSLPKFLHAGTRERLLDGAPALELAYSWRSEGKFLHQRQLITLLAGASPETRTAMMVGATCLRAFSDEWNATFDAMLDSMTLRHPPTDGLADADSTAAAGLAAPADPTVFALSERRRTLHAFADQDEACRKIDAREVEQDAWAFFDGDGNALHPNFVVPNSGTVWRKAGLYVLEARPAVSAPHLREGLARVSVFTPSSPAVPFDSLAAVRARFDQSAQA